MTHRIGFRVATDPRFGAGHLVRSGAIASAVDATAVLFRDPDLPADFDPQLWNKVVPEKSRDSLASAIDTLARGEIAALVIDSYAVSSQAVADASSRGPIAVFRDDDCYGPEQISINCNPGARSAATALSGPSYIPLPAEFSIAHERTRTRPGRLRVASDVLVAFGARDSENYTARALEAIASLSEKPRTIVAVPPSAVHRDNILQLVRSLPWAEPLGASLRLSDVYMDCDLAIGAPGVSQFERACCGLPTILLAQGDIHAPLAAAWERTGAARYCEPKAGALASMLSALQEDVEAIAHMRECALAVVDGRGASRLAEGLKSRLIG